MTARPIEVFDDSRILAGAAARQIADGIELAGTDGRRFVLGCPGGRTPRETYLALADEIGTRRMRTAHLVIAMMDEYVLGEPTEPTAPPPDAHFSCRRFAYEEILAPLTDAAQKAGVAGPRPENILVPSPTDPSAYEDELDGLGGIDLFILASGMSDGHVAFNPAGTTVQARTRVVVLADDTRRDNLMTFPEFGSLDDVPRHGVTVGPATIAQRSQAALLLLSGEHKRRAFERVTAARHYDPQWPATIVWECRSPRVLADRDAAGEWAA